MEDLFGHNRPRHMPTIKAIEDVVYLTADERNSYRGIKDMDFGIESEVVAINNAGFLTDRSTLARTMNDFIPNPDGYFMETVYNTIRDIRPIDIAQVQRLALLNDDQFNTLMTKLPENASNVTVDTLYKYGNILNSLNTLATTVLPEAIEVYRRVATDEHPWTDTRITFLDIEFKMVTLLDDIANIHKTTVTSFQGSMEPTNGTINHVAFNSLIPILTNDIIPMSFGLSRITSTILAQMNTLIGECIRVNKEYHDMSVNYRPGYTPLKRFAQTIEKIPGALDSAVYFCQYTNQYINVLVARNA